MHSNSSLLEATGSSHHSDNPFTLKSKVSIPIGVVGADYNHLGPNVNWKKSDFYGGDLMASTPKFEALDLSYHRVLRQDKNGVSTSATLGFKAPLSNPSGLIPRLVLKGALGRTATTILTASMNHKNKAQITGDLQLNHKFDVADSVTGMLKGDIKQSFTDGDTEAPPPTVSLAARLMEKNNEYGILYTSKKHKLAMISAFFLPATLKMHPFVNAFIPTAIGFKVEAPVDKLHMSEAYTRTGLLSYALGKRSRDSPMALNLSINGHSDVTATVLCRRILASKTDSGDKLSMVYSASSKMNVEDLISGKSSSPLWGIKLDVSGDVNSLGLMERFALW